MRPSQRTSGFYLDEVGGAVNRIQSVATTSEVDTAEDSEAYADLYPAVPVFPTAHRHRNTKNRLKALAIAEGRLNKLCEELLDLADEIRHLHPAMADALDDAWNGADTALETLLDEDVW